MWIRVSGLSFVAHRTRMIADLPIGDAAAEVFDVQYAARRDKAGDRKREALSEEKNVSMVVAIPLCGGRHRVRLCGAAGLVVDLRERERNGQCHDSVLSRREPPCALVVRASHPRTTPPANVTAPRVE